MTLQQEASAQLRPFLMSDFNPIERVKLVDSVIKSYGESVLTAYKSSLRKVIEKEFGTNVDGKFIAVEKVLFLLETVKPT